MNYERKPSEVSEDRLAYSSTFGWGELESAAEAIVKNCLEQGDSFSTVVTIDEMKEDWLCKLGFTALISMGYLKEAEEVGESPWEFVVTSKFIKQLNFKQNAESSHSTKES